MSFLRRLPAIAAALLCAPSLPALEISEILTENEGGLQDADFASPGWIELHNETAAPVDLGGWRLTDDPLILNKWTLPSQNLAAGGYLVVFASGKNRAVAGVELHTNFQIDPDGEYLALVRPDNIIARQFTPKFPQLRRNVSYSEAPVGITTLLVAEGAAVRYHVPADGALGTTWTEAGFADGGWTAGTTGLGFDAAGASAKLDFKSASSATAIPSPAGWTSVAFSSVPEVGTGPASATVTAGAQSVKLDGVGTTLAARNRQGGSFDSLNNAASLNNVAEDFLFSSTSNYIAGTPRGMDMTLSGFTAGTIYPVTLWAYDRASGGVRSAVWTDTVSGASAGLAFSGSDGQLLDDAAFNARSVTFNATSNASGQIILQGRAAANGHTSSHNVFLNAVQVGTLSFLPLIAANVSAAMQGTASSLYTRAIFTVANPSYYHQLRLRVMDQRVVATTPAGYGITEALRSAPTLSIALAPSDFLGSNGIYQNPQSLGASWERDCSVELIDPTGAENGFHETCRVEIHGNSSRRPWRMQKHSFRLSFKGEAGASRLRYRFFPGSSFASINKLILRATFTDGWGLVSWSSSRYRPDDSVMMRDVWMRKSWEEMGNLSPNSRFIHVVINGLYWGVYDAAEHIDDDYVSDHEGGLPADWEVVSDFVDPDGSATSPWKTMFTAAAADLSVQANYQAVLQWLDPVNFADYYLLHQFAECEDWPHHNGSAWRNKVIPGSKYKWLAWDQEIALQETGATNGHNIDRISPSAPNTTTARTPGPLWNSLRANKEWRLLVADRAHALLNNGGPLSATVAAARWQGLAATLDKPIVAESARWGDTVSELPYGGDDSTGTPVKVSRPGVPLKSPYLRDPDWLGAINYVSNTWIPSLHNRANSYATITRLSNQALRLWPATEPPAFAQHGGNVPVGYDLVISAPAGAIYYTLNGTDPRTPVSGAAAGTLYSGPVDLTVTARVKARAVTGSPGSGTEIWSALTDAQFIAGTAASTANLAISEICYNPPGAVAWEFIELTNISAGPIDLTGVQFTAGIAFSFAPGTLLASGQRLVLANDAAAFTAQFAGVMLLGTYTGKLDNNGEELALVAANSSDIRRFTYNDKLPWPVAPDGNGYSLTLIAPLTNPDHALPQNWRSSVLPNGTPGTSDAVSFAGNPNADSDGDGLTDFLEYALGDPALAAILLPGGTPAMLLTRRTAADDAFIIVESSPDFTTWTPLPDTSLSAASAPSGGTMTETWMPLPGVMRSFMRARVEMR